MYEAQISVDPDPNKLDPKIRSLVRALNEMGLTTFSSCEGHEPRAEPNQWPCPMVVVVLDSATEAFTRLVKYVGDHNSQWQEAEKVCWTLTPHRGTFSGVILKPNDDPARTLEQQQAGIRSLVDNLQAMQWLHKRKTA